MSMSGLACISGNPPRMLVGVRLYDNCTMTLGIVDFSVFLVL